jgi:hypothetical protein
MHTHTHTGDMTVMQLASRGEWNEWIRRAGAEACEWGLISISPLLRHMHYQMHSFPLRLLIPYPLCFGPASTVLATEAGH